MYYTYVLKSQKDRRLYIGSTDNLERRLKQHKLGTTRTTRILKTDTLVYTEVYNTLLDARNREKKLKSYKSRKYLEWLISTNKLGR